MVWVFSPNRKWGVPGQLGAMTLASRVADSISEEENGENSSRKEKEKKNGNGNLLVLGLVRHSMHPERERNGKCPKGLMGLVSSHCVAGPHEPAVEAGNTYHWYGVL